MSLMAGVSPTSIGPSVGNGITLLAQDTVPLCLWVAEAQPLDALHFAPARGEDDERKRRAGAPDLPQDLESVAVWQREIEQDEMAGELERCLEAGVAGEEDAARPRAALRG